MSLLRLLRGMSPSKLETKPLDGGCETVSPGRKRSLAPLLEPALTTPTKTKRLGLSMSCEQYTLETVCFIQFSSTGPGPTLYLNLSRLVGQIAQFAFGALTLA